MASLNLEIGEAQIQNAIAVAITEAFSQDKRDQLLRDIIRAHMSVKQNSYDRETLLSKEVGQMVRSVAVKVMKAKVEEWRPEIEAIVSKMIGPNFKANVTQQLEVALGNMAYRNINIKAEVVAEEED